MVFQKFQILHGYPFRFKSILTSLKFYDDHISFKIYPYFISQRMCFETYVWLSIKEMWVIDKVQPKMFNKMLHGGVMQCKWWAYVNVECFVVVFICDKK